VSLLAASRPETQSTEGKAAALLKELLSIDPDLEAAPNHEQRSPLVRLTRL
jgi:hypothetical protein